MSENSSKKGFQFVDRRRFDSTGEERKVEAAKVIVVADERGTDAEEAQRVQRPSQQHGRMAAPGEPAAGKEAQATLPVTEEFRPEASENPDEEVTLTSFVMSLATQTMVQLGEMDPPPGMEIPIDVESARNTIDIISMLQRKTKGNLSSDEARFVSEVLQTLRMSYVRKSK